MTGPLFIVPIMASLLLTGCISSADLDIDEHWIPATVKGGGVEVVFDSAVLHDPPRPRGFVVEIGGTRIESSVEEGIRAFGSLRIDTRHLLYDGMRAYDVPEEFVSELKSNHIVKDSSERRGATGALSMGWVVSFLDVVLWMGMRSEDPAVREEAAALFEHLCQSEGVPFVADTGL